MDNSVQLPLEIVAEILLKLPVKSILKFKTVCKCWNSIINDTHFAKRHLKLALSFNFFNPCSHGQNQLNRPLLYTQHPDGTIHAKDFHIPEEYECHSLSNSCDGLLCFIMDGDRDQIFVWNPCLPTAVKIIPALPLHHDKIALGYDPTSDDYKIVKVPYKCSFEDKSLGVEVFSFKTNSWKTMWFPLTTSLHYYLIVKALVYARNCVHWLATERYGGDKESRRIMYFDLVGESLELMNLPSPNLYCPTLMNYKDSITISGLNSNLIADFWVLEDYCGMKSSWKKMFCVNFKDWSIGQFIGVTLNGQIFVRTREGGLRVYDPRDGILGDDLKGRIVARVNNCFCFFSPSPYVQSLLSPTQLH